MQLISPVEDSSCADEGLRFSRFRVLGEPMGYVDGTNLYEYVKDDPVNRVDPFGLAATAPASQPATRPADESRQFFASDDVILNGTVTVNVAFGDTVGIPFIPPMMSIVFTYVIKDNFVSSESYEPRALGVPIPFAGGSEKYKPGNLDNKAFTNSIKTDIKAQTSFQFKDTNGKPIDNTFMKAYVTAEFRGSIATKNVCHGIKGDAVFDISGSAMVKTKKGGEWSDAFAAQEDTEVKKPFVVGTIKKDAVSVGKIAARAGESVALGGTLGDVSVEKGGSVTWSLLITGEKFKNP